MMLGLVCLCCASGVRAVTPAQDDIARWSVVKLVQSGRDAVASGDRGRARSLAEAAVARDSGYAEAWKLLATLQLQAGETNAAAQAFRTALMIAPRDGASNRELAWLLWDKERDQALTRLDTVIQTGTPDREALIRRVLALLAETGEGPRALGLFKKWKPSFTLGELGLALFSAGRHEAAMPFLGAAWEAGENRADIGLYYAFLAGRKGDGERAAASLKAFLEKAPDSLSREQVELVWECVLVAKFNEDLKSLRGRIEKTYPVESDRRAGLAKRFELAASKLLRRGDEDSARELYRQAVVLDASRVPIEDWIMTESRAYGTGNLLIAKSRACAADGDWEGAKRMAALAVTNNVADAEAWKQVGIAHARLQQHDEALGALEKAVGLNPNDAVAYSELGWELWTTAQGDKACEAWEHALALGMKDRDRFVMQVVGRLNEEGKSATALGLFARWLPGRPAVQAGLEFFRAGRAKAAEPLLEKAWNEGTNQASVGLYLARTRTLNSKPAGALGYLEPYVASCLSTAAAPDVILFLDTLRFCSGVPGVGETLDAAARALSGRPEQASAVNDIYVLFARNEQDRGNSTAALVYYEKVLERDPNLLIWPIAWNLAVSLKDVPRGMTLLSNLQARATAPAVHSGVDAKLAECRGDLEAAVAGYVASLEAAPGQPELHGSLFDLSLKLGNIDQARRAAEWMQGQIKEGAVLYRADLASMWGALGEDGKAAEAWQFLRLAMPEVPYYSTELALAQYRLGRGNEAVETLKESLGQAPSQLGYEMMVEVLTALGRSAEAIQWARQGLATYSSPALRRSLAEHLDTMETSGMKTSTVVAAQACLLDDPGSVSVSLLLARALDASARSDEAADLHRQYLGRNADFAPGLVFMRDHEIVVGHPRRALAYAERLMKSQPADDEAARRYAMNLAEADGFSRAMRILEPMAARNEKSVTAVLVYDNTTSFDYPGMNTVSQMVAHINRLVREGFVFVNAVPGGKRPDWTVMMILVNPDGAVLEAIDAALQANTACAVVMMSAESLRHQVPRKPTPGRLAELRQSGRWQVGVMADDMGPVPVRADGVKGNPLTHRIMTEGQWESLEAMSNRVGAVLASASATLGMGKDRLFFYPAGDYGQMSLDTDRAAMNVLSNAVGQVFTGAFCRDDSGFVSSRLDYCRIPAKPVSSSWTPDDLVNYLRQANPVVKSRLELAKLFYWQGQSEAATHWFRQARDAGANPFELTFNEAANAAMEGDLPVALGKSREALGLAPAGDQRPTALMAKALDLRRPTVALKGTEWRDNEDRRFGEVSASAEGPVRDWLRWNAAVSRHDWEKKDLGHERGSAAELGFLAYVAPEVWLQGGLQEWSMDTLPDLTGWDARLHLPNQLLHGNIELTSQREMMDTVEALRKEIMAHREGIETYSRLYDYWDCYLDGAVSQRSDNNDTWWLDGRIVRRIKETPYLGLGYAGRMADSTRQVPEYWSPDQLQQHQGYAAWQGTGVRWNSQLSGQTGFAKERDTGWRYIWGVRAVAVYKFTPRVNVGGDVNYQTGPIYSRTTLDAFINLRW